VVSNHRRVPQDRVNKFRSQKEVLKAQYQAARAQTAVSQTATGISRWPPRFARSARPPQAGEDTDH